MQLVDYLNKNLIIAPVKSKDKEGLFEELVERLAEIKKLDSKEELLKSIMEREECASTFLPIGIAIPHARTNLVDEIVMVAGVSPEGIVDEGEVTVKANVFFLFFSPLHEKEFGQHLKILARVASIFSDGSFAKELSKLVSPEEVFEALRLREAQLDEQ